MGLCSSKKKKKEVYAIACVGHGKNYKRRLQAQGPRLLNLSA